MNYLQKLGKALMLPIACLPLCGLLMGLGYFLCPESMQGGNISGISNSIGYFLVIAGSSLIDNIALLFVISVGIGMSEKNDGVGGLAALASWLIITTLLSENSVTIIFPNLIDQPTEKLAFNKIDNPFIGIIAGIIGSFSFNKFKNINLPNWISFFSGKRCVAIVSGLISIVISFALLLLWPYLFKLLIAFGQNIAKMDALGAGIYAFINRLLIPFGMHHALNNVFWFDTIGLGDLTHYWAGHTSNDVSWSLGMYMSGFFPCMMFGIPGAALAIVLTTSPTKRIVTAGIMLSAAICSFICGVTEPFEFAFMFVSPILYFIYALLYGIFTFVAVSIGFRAGFCFSGGLIDLIFSASLPASQNTWLIIPLGILAFFTFYLTFSLVIRKFDLKIIDKDDQEEAFDSETNYVKNEVPKDFVQKAEILLKGLGGWQNIISLDHCITRLRLEINDFTKINEPILKLGGSLGLIKINDKSIQVVIGTKVQFIAEELEKLKTTQNNTEQNQLKTSVESINTSLKNSDNKKLTTITHNDPIYFDNLDFIDKNQFNFTVKNNIGIHARPAGSIVQIVKKHSSNVTFSSNGKIANAKSIVELMSLGVKHGSTITVSANGNNAKDVLIALYEFMEKNL